MKNQQFIETLLELGLSEKEARVYHAALSLGPTTALKVSQLSGLKRPTVYAVVENLKERGLMSFEVKGFKRFLVASPPEKLEYVLEQRRQKFKNMLPDLQTLYRRDGAGNFIKQYDGLNAIKQVYESLIEDVRPKEDYLIVGNQERWYSLDPEYFKGFTERRAKLNINIRMLLQDNEAGRKFKKLERNMNAQIKLLPEGAELTTNLVVIPKKAVIHQLVPPLTALVVENRSVVQMHQQMFWIMWNQLPA